MEEIKNVSKNTELLSGVIEKLSASNIQNQNANLDEASFGGRTGEASSFITKKLALETLVSDMARKNHENNEIYIHDLDSYYVGMHNCFPESQGFLTVNGFRKFSDFKDGDSVLVVNKLGDWVPGIVKSYGTQLMYDLVFELEGTSVHKKITCTRNHNWVLSDNSVTDNIKVGDKLLKTPSIAVTSLYKKPTKGEVENWCHGYSLGRCLKQNDNLSMSLKYLLSRETLEKLEFDDLEEIFDGFKKYYTFELSEKIVINKDSENLKYLFNFLNLIPPIFRNEVIVEESEGKVLIKLLDLEKENKLWVLKSIELSDVNKSDSEGVPAWCLEVERSHSFILEEGLVTGNCLSIPFDDLLRKGFTTRQVDIRPCRSIDTAFQLVAVIFQIQSLQQFGGVSATHLDWTMIPYVRMSFYKHFKKGMDYVENLRNYEFDFEPTEAEISIQDERFKKHDRAYRYALDSTIEELDHSVDGLYHNLNSLQSRSGCQLPFTSINFGTCTLEEGRLVSKALLNGSIRGVGKFHTTSIFPCVIFQRMKGVNDIPGTKNYDIYRLALSSTARRNYPNYANVDWSGNEGYDINDPRTYFSTMGCRTANGFDINGFGQLKDGRGNICPVTIILPTLAMEARLVGDSKEEEFVTNFFNILETKIDEAKDMLLERFEWICSQKPNSAKFMYENNTMAGYIPEEGIRSALKHGTLALGQLGLAEALQLLIGENHTTEKGMRLAKRIESLFKNKCDKFKKKYKLNFGVYYTPAENLCHTALVRFRNKYGIINKVSDKEFFTNSMHVPVWENMDPFKKIDIESQLTGYSSAGCITYVELGGSIINNIDALETLVNYAMDKDIPYFAVNVPNDTCMDCGHTGEINNKCPECGSGKISRLRRVTGYLSVSYENFNLGKRDEVENRVKHLK